MYEAPWALVKFLDLESGYLFEAQPLIKFHRFLQEASLFHSKTLNIKKRQRFTMIENEITDFKAVKK